MSGALSTISALHLTGCLPLELEESLRQQRAAWEATEQERIALQSLLISERQMHMQAEKQSDPLRGISSTTVPAFVEALDKLAQLTDKIAV